MSAMDVVRAQADMARLSEFDPSPKRRYGHDYDGEPGKRRPSDLPPIDSYAPDRHDANGARGWLSIGQLVRVAIGDPELLRRK